MNLKTWETIINQIVEETSCQRNESGRLKVLLMWRAKLEKGTTSLEPYQIDEIIWEVRKRLPRRGR